jgi:hypothetical protein
VRWVDVDLGVGNVRHGGERCGFEFGGEGERRRASLRGGREVGDVLLLVVGVGGGRAIWVGLLLLVFVVLVVGVSVVSWRPHTTHCAPMCAVLHIGHGAVVFVVRARCCVVVAPHTWGDRGQGSSSSSIASRGEKGLLVCGGDLGVGCFSFCCVWGFGLGSAFFFSSL